MSSSRKMVRAQQGLQKKETKQQFKQITRVIDGMKKSCHSCGAAFDNQNPYHLDNWRVNVFDDYAELVCDKCHNQSVDNNPMENFDEQGTSTETA